jgi:hypothetical protein
VVLLALVAGCGPPRPTTLEELTNKHVWLMVGFDPAPPRPPLLAAFFEFDDRGFCPPFELAVDLDGVALEYSPDTVGTDGTTCQVAYWLTTSAPPPAPQSTVRFTHASGVVSATFARLLERRTWTTNIAAGSRFRAGDTIGFDWSTDSDALGEADAFFIMGTTKQLAVTELLETTALVTVPAVAPGVWTVAVGGTARAAVVECAGLVSCGSVIVREDRLELTVD